jgi:hypothetical protein
VEARAGELLSAAFGAATLPPYVAWHWRTFAVDGREEAADVAAIQRATACAQRMGEAAGATRNSTPVLLVTDSHHNRRCSPRRALRGVPAPACLPACLPLPAAAPCVFAAGARGEWRPWPSSAQRFTARKTCSKSSPRAARAQARRRVADWRGRHDLRGPATTRQRGAVLGSGLPLAERLGDIAGMGSRGRVHPGKTPRPRHKIRRVGKVLSIGPLREG